MNIIKDIIYKTNISLNNSKINRFKQNNLLDFKLKYNKQIRKYIKRNLRTIRSSRFFYYLKLYSLRKEKT